MIGALKYMVEAGWMASIMQPTARSINIRGYVWPPLQGKIYIYTCVRSVCSLNIERSVKFTRGARG